MSSPYLSINDLSAAYDKSSRVVSNISFNLEEGEIGCLLGPSGCGKTTILRAISGFQAISTGSIELAGKLLSAPKKMLAPENRGVGMVFQDHALFPHLTLANNVRFGLSKLSKDEQVTQTDKMLTLVGMQDFRDAYPHEISGGQSQRVALARALAPKPTLLLMDEPFSNLDTTLREDLGYEVRQLLKETGITAIMVTHDQHDAFALGDKIGVIANGQLQQWSSSFDLYHAPKSRFVANFIGDGLFVEGRVIDKTTVATNFGEIQGELVNSINIDTKVDLLIRPDDVRYDPKGSIKGVIDRKAFKGAQTLYTLRTESGESLMSLVSSHDNHDVGDRINLTIEADHLVCFESNR